MEEETNDEIKSAKLKLLNDKLLDIKPKKLTSENEILNTEPPLPITLSRKMRWMVYFLLMYIATCMELDQGILSSATDALSKDLELNDNELGGLGSMIFLGKALGCVIFFTLINKLNRKYMLLVTSFLTILSLILTTQTKNLVLLYLCRIIIGIAQCYVGVYSPVWADQFGIHKYKSIMLSLQHLTSCLGYLFGYVMGLCLGWVLGFYVEDIMLIISFIILFFISNKYFSMSLMPLKSKMILLEKEGEPKNKKEKEDDKLEKEIKKIKVTVLDESYQEEENKEIKEDNKEKEEENNEKEEIDLKDDISLFEDIQQQDNNMSQRSLLLQIKAIIKSPLFILINVTLCSIYAIVAAIQFWINDYVQYPLGIEEADKRFLLFGSIMVTALPSGMILGGIILSKVGGYESEKAIYIPLIFSLIVSICANLATLSDSVYLFYPIFWVYFFCGSAIIPSANGISLVSVEKKYAGAASSMSTLLYNVLGRFPGPNFYAFFKSLVDDITSRIPMWLLLNLADFGFLAVLIAIKFNKKKFMKLREELLEKERMENENNNKNEENNDNNNQNDSEEVETIIVDSRNNDTNNINNVNEREIINNDNDTGNKIIKFDDENSDE